jgi:hypothetical protein
MWLVCEYVMYDLWVCEYVNMLCMTYDLCYVIVCEYVMYDLWIKTNHVTGFHNVSELHKKCSQHLDHSIKSFMA